MRMPRLGETGDLTLTGVTVVDVHGEPGRDLDPYIEVAVPTDLGTDRLKVAISNDGRVQWRHGVLPSWPPREGQLYQSEDGCRWIAVMFQADPKFKHEAEGVDEFGGRVILLPMDGASLRNLGCDQYRPEWVLHDHGPLGLVDDLGPAPQDVEPSVEKRLW